jgi:hypothetical protein
MRQTGDTMIRRAWRAAAPAAVLAAGLGLAGCSSSTAGQGTGQFTPVVTVDPGSGSPTAGASPSMTQGGGGGGGGGGGEGSTGSGGTRTATPTRTAATDPNARAELGSFQVASGPNCTGTSGSSTVTMTWQTTGADEVWIQVTPVAVAASDPRTTPGSVGPLPANGSRTLPFDCRGQYDYYNIGVYNRGNGTHTGQIRQVARNI